MVATIIRNNTCASLMLWAPNTGYGYPWPYYACGPTRMEPRLDETVHVCLLVGFYKSCHLCAGRTHRRARVGHRQY